LTVISTRSLSV